MSIDFKNNMKTSDWHYLTASYWPEVTVQSHFLDSFSKNINQFAIKNLLSVLLQSFLISTARNFNNSKPIYVILWEMINHYRNISFVKLQNGSIYFWKNNPKNWQIFQLFNLYLKGRHSSLTKLYIPNFL